MKKTSNLKKGRLVGSKNSAKESRGSEPTLSTIHIQHDKARRDQWKKVIAEKGGTRDYPALLSQAVAEASRQMRKGERGRRE